MSVIMNRIISFNDEKVNLIYKNMASLNYSQYNDIFKSAVTSGQNLCSSSARLNTSLERITMNGQQVESMRNFNY